MGYTSRGGGKLKKGKRISKPNFETGPKPAQRFVSAHASVQNLFKLGGNLFKAEHSRDLRESAFN